MFVCLLVCAGLMEIETPAPILRKLWRVQVSFWCRFDLCPPLGLGGLKY